MNGASGRPLNFTVRRLVVDASVLKALLGNLIALVLVGSAIALYRPRRTTGMLLLVLGTCCFVVVAFTHVCESLRILPVFGWGQRDSVGHYLDLVAALVGLALVACGLLFQYVRAAQSRNFSAGFTPSNNR